MTVWTASWTESGTATTLKVVDAWFAGMTTDDGTVASALLLVASVTVSGWELSVPMRVTVATAVDDVPVFSTMVCGLMLTCKPDGTVRVSRSSMVGRARRDAGRDIRDLAERVRGRNILANRFVAHVMMRPSS